MAIQLLKENDSFNTYHQHFLIDSSDDLTSLEANYKCQMGDVAEAVDGTKYVRHSDGYSGDLWEEAGGSGGSELPAVTSSDNGDVLTVVNGAWDKVDPDTIVLHVDEETFALDKTWQEITNLLAAGKRLVFFFTNTEMYGAGGGTQATIIATSSSNNGYAVWSFGYQISGDQPQWYDFRAFADTANDYPYVD